MSEISAVDFESLVALLRDRDKATNFVHQEVLRLEGTPVAYMDIALRVADVLLNTPSAVASLTFLTGWTLAVAEHDVQRYLMRMRIIITALVRLQQNMDLPDQTERIALLIMEQAFRRHGITPPDQILKMQLKMGQQLILQKRGWEAIGG